MNTKALVDPVLALCLDNMPGIEPSTQSLPGLRSAMADFRQKAPPAPEIAVRERFIRRPDGSNLRALVYASATSGRSGGLLWMHGGGMIMGEPDTSDAQSRYLAKCAGCVVVAIDYRLAPEHPHPAGLEDCYLALRWMHEAADELRLDREQIAVSGESGGGCLAAALSVLARDRGDFKISGQFLQYPMLDDRTGTASDVDPMPYAGEFVWTRASNRFAWGAVLGRDPGETSAPEYAAPSRVKKLDGLPYTCIVIGNLDLFIGENLRFANDLIRQGVATELHVYAGAFHGFMSFCEDAIVTKRAESDLWGAIQRHFLRT